MSRKFYHGLYKQDTPYFLAFPSTDDILTDFNRFFLNKNSIKCFLTFSFKWFNNSVLN